MRSILLIANGWPLEKLNKAWLVTSIPEPGHLSRWLAIWLNKDNELCESKEAPEEVWRSALKAKQRAPKQQHLLHYKFCCYSDEAAILDKNAASVAEQPVENSCK